MLDTSHGRKFLGHSTKVFKMNMVIAIWRKTKLKRKQNEEKTGMKTELKMPTVLIDSQGRTGQ